MVLFPSFHLHHAPALPVDPMGIFMKMFHRVQEVGYRNGEILQRAALEAEGKDEAYEKWANEMASHGMVKAHYCSAVMIVDVVFITSIRSRKFERSVIAFLYSVLE